MTTLQVGSQTIDEADAESIIRNHVKAEPGLFGFSAYDGYRTNDDPDSLSDGDLLAPVLLNVRMPISAYVGLRGCVPTLEPLLRAIPSIPLASADDATLTAIGNLYALLDGDDRPTGVQGTVLAKVLHRKRPETVPLYDEQVRAVYQDGVRIPAPDSARSWVEFMTLFATAVRDDLAAALPAWDRLADLASPSGPRLTPLRALDMVAWKLGDNLR